MNKPTTQTVHALLLDVKEDITEIKEQTIRTNGRVNSLESRQDKLDGALNIIKLIIVPILLAIIMEMVTRLA